MPMEDTPTTQFLISCIK